MKVKDKDKFTYIYDYASSTELVCKVLSEFKLDENLTDPAIIARNDIPQIKCDHCDNLATEICCNCIDEGAGMLCKRCLEEHKCDEEIFLPVVNSPRMGVCGYCG